MLGEQMRPVANPELPAIARGFQLTPPARYPDGRMARLRRLLRCPRRGCRRRRPQGCAPKAVPPQAPLQLTSAGFSSPALTIRSTLTVRDPALRPTGSPRIRAGETLFLIGFY
jgi:hypothetical protein